MLLNDAKEQIFGPTAAVRKGLVQRHWAEC